MQIIQHNIGRHGGFGNNLFQAITLHKWCEQNNAIFEIPSDWIGRRIFPNINNPTFSKDLPVDPGFDLPNKDGKDYRMGGFYQFKEALAIWTKEDACHYFTIDPIMWKQHVEVFKNRFNTPVIACHRRTGDFRQTPYPIISKLAYEKCCEENNLNKSEIFYFGNEEEKLPQLYEGELSLISDFIYIMLCDVIIRGNSTYSWWASTLSGKLTYAPIIQNKSRGDLDNVEWVCGNWPATVFYEPYITDLHK